MNSPGGRKTTQAECWDHRWMEYVTVILSLRCHPSGHCPKGRHAYWQDPRPAIGGHLVINHTAKLVCGLTYEVMSGHISHAAEIRTAISEVKVGRCSPQPLDCTRFCTTQDGGKWFEESENGHKAHPPASPKGHQRLSISHPGLLS